MTKSMRSAIKEIERLLCFTDLPCGALDITDGEKKEQEIPEITTVLSKEASAAIKEVERSIFFTDVPCGALKVDDSVPSDTSTSKGRSFLERLVRALCFSDLKGT